MMLESSVSKLTSTSRTSMRGSQRRSDARTAAATRAAVSVSARSVGGRRRRKGAAGDHVRRRDGYHWLVANHHLGTDGRALTLPAMHAGHGSAHVDDWARHHITCSEPLLTSTIVPVTFVWPLDFISSCGPPSRVAPEPPFRPRLVWASSVIPCCADSLRLA